jgi:uncharacterized membrane-anchored protein YhcB (DUF1043 family)
MKWKLDKRIPIGVIIGLGIQLAAALVWATQLDARVNRVELQIYNQSGLNERFARLEERLDNVKEDTNTVKQLLAQLAENLLSR